MKKVFSNLNIPAGYFFDKGSAKKDNRRNILKCKQNTKEFKCRRKHLRHERKGYIDVNKELEGGDCYKTGSF